MPVYGTGVLLWAAVTMTAVDDQQYDNNNDEDKQYGAADDTYKHTIICATGNIAVIQIHYYDPKHRNCNKAIS